MITWTKILGVGVLLYAAYLIYRGEIDMTSNRRADAPTVIYKRSEKPGVFWGIIVLLALFAALLLWNPFDK
jgi:hypothetical protein